MWKRKKKFLSFSARYKLNEGIHSSLLLRSTFQAQFNNSKRKKGEMQTQKSLLSITFYHFAWSE
jgi:hypothetical protein